MALPNEHRTESVTRVQNLISKMSDKEIRELPPLTRDDREMVGNLIQTYNFIDLNLRRALEIFNIAGIFPTSLKYDNVRDSELSEIVSDIISKNDAGSEDIAASVENLKIISYCRTYRNLVAHFSAKRFPGEEVLIFATKNEHDAQRILGRKLRKHHVFRAVAGRQDYAI